MSTIKTKNIAHPSATTSAITLNEDGSMGGSFPYPNRNLLYNGAFQINQRGTSVTGITTGDYRTSDRWFFAVGTMGTWTQDIQNDAPTGSGFRNSFRALCTTADVSPAAGDLVLLEQRLEGQDLQRIRKGTTSAQKLTLSFWVKSNVAGTYAIDLRDADNSRNVSQTYTINASSTWERKSVTFPADTVGVLDNDANHSLSVRFWLGAGSSFTGTPLQTSWGTNSNLATGQVNLASAINNSWQVTGVQLEIGNVTDFEFKSYGQELRECQRYFQRFTGGSNNGPFFPAGFYFDTGNIHSIMQFMGTMRAAPTISFTGTANTDYGIFSNSNINAGWTIGFERATPTGAIITNSKTAHGLTQNTTNLFGLATNGAVNISAEL